MFRLSYAKLNDSEVWSIEKISQIFTMLDIWESETNTSLYNFNKVKSIKFHQHLTKVFQHTLAILHQTKRFKTTTKMENNENNQIYKGPTDTSWIEGSL